MKTGIILRKRELKKELKRIVGVIVEKYSPEKVVLFGSLASGNIHMWSDIDLLIIKKTKERFIDRLHRLRLMTRPREGVDFVVYTPDEFESMKKEKRRFLTQEILKRGKVLYGAKK